MAYSTQAYMQGSGYTNVAEAYHDVIGISASKSDTAYLYGPSTGSNSFVAMSTQAYMQGSGYLNVATSFTSVLAISASGTTRPTSWPLDRQQHVQRHLDAILHGPATDS